VVGSNIFNILSVLGLSSIVAPAGITVSDAALRFDIPVMIAIAVACLPIFFVGYRISRFNGASFLFFYVAYIVYLIFTATNHDSLGTLRTAMIYFILPITLLTLIVITVREIAMKRKSLL
jgi:cation:H+ antiporter